MFNLKFGVFTFALCLLLTSCVCGNPCTIQDTTATCESIENFKSLENATNITKLIVRSKELKRINKDDFTVFVNLEEIDLSNSGLEEIDENAFASLTKLHKINLAGNTKLKIPNDASFITSSTLTCLNLSNTIVEELDKTFTHLEQLQILDLSGTNIKDFSPLGHLEHLTKIVVTKNTDTKDLCNILSIKEIIEKDANETESLLECKTEVKAPETKTEASTTVKQIEEPEVATKTNEIKTNETKIDDTKLVEASTIAAENEEPKILEPAKIVPETAETSTIPIKTEGSKTGETTPETKIEEPKPTIPTKIETPENKTKEEPKKEDDPKKEAPGKKENEAKTEKPEVIAVVTTSHTEYNTATEKPIIKDKKHPKENLIAAPKMKDESQKVMLEASDDAILPSTASTSQSNGVNIVLGIILCVMVVGAIGFGYKYWKNRRTGYTHANTQENDDEDKELQTIVAHRTDPDQN